MNGSDALAIQKRSLREDVLARLKALAPAERAAAGRALVAAVRGRLGAGPVALFASLPHEIHTAPLDAALRADGVLRALPSVEGGALVFRVLFGDDDVAALPRGALGIPTPPSSRPLVSLTACSAAVVPCVAVDAAGRRLGYGKGYYDRALSSGMPPFVVAVGLDVQRVPVVPVDDRDVPVPFSWTPSTGLLAHALR